MIKNHSCSCSDSCSKRKYPLLLRLLLKNTNSCRSTGVDSGRSWRFSARSGAGLGVDIFDWNRNRNKSDF